MIKKWWEHWQNFKNKKKLWKPLLGIADVSMSAIQYVDQEVWRGGTENNAEIKLSSYIFVYCSLSLWR